MLITKSRLIESNTIGFRNSNASKGETCIKKDMKTFITAENLAVALSMFAKNVLAYLPISFPEIDARCYGFTIIRPSLSIKPPSYLLRLLHPLTDLRRNIPPTRFRRAKLEHRILLLIQPLFKPNNINEQEARAISDCRCQAALYHIQNCPRLP